MFLFLHSKYILFVNHLWTTKCLCFLCFDYCIVHCRNKQEHFRIYSTSYWFYVNIRRYFKLHTKWQRLSNILGKTTYQVIRLLQLVISSLIHSVSPEDQALQATLSLGKTMSSGTLRSGDRYRGRHYGMF